MKKNALVEIAESFAARGNVTGIQGYFEAHQTRLSTTLDFFDLWSLTGSRVLEIGPFYSYTPFLFRRQGNEVTVIEGNDPVMEPLLKLYSEEGIRCDSINLLRIFSLSEPEKARMPYPDASFDTLVCFETMEHFSFNPVHFVREVHRILAPGGRAYITVPNLAKLHSRLRLLMGETIRTPIDDYYRFADYNAGEFLGFHWREYLLHEIVELFSRSAFEIERSAHIQSFIDREDASFSRRLKRAVGASAIALFPGLAQNCAIIAKKA
jgi:SAM-dependent methyltransferase